jgi:hypothetical protein
VTEPLDDDQPVGATDDAEIVDALPVPDGTPMRDAPPLAVSAPQRSGAGVMLANPLAMQAAAVAVTGFAAGAATVAVVRRRRARRPRRKERKLMGDVRASRSFLVDIHLLDRG